MVNYIYEENLNLKTPPCIIFDYKWNPILANFGVLSLACFVQIRFLLSATICQVKKSIIIP